MESHQSNRRGHVFGHGIPPHVQRAVDTPVQKDLITLDL